MSEDDEPILLHEQDLMLALLRAAADGPATLDDALARLLALRERAHEPPPEDRDELLRRLERDARALRAAGALRRDGEVLRLTERGRELLATSAGGVDGTVLMRYPEYRAYVASTSRSAAASDPRADANDAGYRAFQLGRPHTDNPHPPDSVDHLAWESGWFEARDEAAARR
jgi:hypothetical protein